MDIFGGKRYLVYGAGVSGKAACKAIRRNGGKARLADGDGLPKDGRYDGAVISPGVKPTHAVYDYCARSGIPVLGEVDIGFAIARAADRQVVGVTGTNGKTTVTRLIADMIGGVACGNIGYPVSLAAMEKTAAPLVCELSSFQLYSSNIAPDVAVITNTAPDHIDWHGSAAAYYAAKCNIARNMTGGYLIIGDDVTVGALDALDTKATLLRCSVDRPTDGAYISDGCFCFGGKRVCPTDYLRLQGEHNVKNALCAIAAAECMGATPRQILAALSSVEPSPHRTETVGEFCGKLWIDDSKGTNVAACRAAVAQTTGTVCLILGGRSKATDFSELFASIDPRVIEVVAMGESAQSVRDSACECAPGLKVTVVDKLADAVAAAATSNAETVLLSPACASFDEFESYARRGERFKAEVCALARRNKS